MQSIKFYDELPDMEFFSGDTLQPFSINVIVDDETTTLGSSLYLMISASSDPTVPIVKKECRRSEVENTFTVQLNSEDTVSLNEGTYYMYLTLVDTELMEYKKKVCCLYVHSAPRCGI